MASPLPTLIGFLKEHNIDCIPTQDLQSTVDANYDALSDEVLRLLIAKAIQERDSKLLNDSVVADKELLGSWGVIIDTIRNTKIKRQEIAVKNISTIMSYNRDSTPQNLIRFLKDLQVAGQIDTTFKDILENSYGECIKNNHEDSASVYKFAIDVVERLEKVERTKPSQSKLSSSTTPPPTVSSATNTVATESVASLNNSTGKAIHTNTSADSVSPHKELSIESLESSGELLSKLMAECQGNFPLLKGKLLHLLNNHQHTSASSTTASADRITESTSNTIHLEAFLVVLNDNIEACKIAGYVNKVKLFECLKEVITTFQRDAAAANNKKRTNDAEIKNNDDDDDSTILTAHHAPQFVDSINKKSKLSNQRSSDTSSGNIEELEESHIQVLAPLTFINGTNLMNNLLHTNIKNMKKKTEKRLEKQKADAVLHEISSSLNQSSYAVIDNFLPVELIKRVRIESGLFINHYEQSEIWVGKEADVGAHIQVPSVRGDKVLWMCGGHDKKNFSSAPETGGGTRAIKNIGEIEPCKLEVKAAAPIKKFIAMSELMSAMDTLVEKLSPLVPKLNHIYERSDAMLAVYPGEGSRFANHIDNTTKDGRRLTVLVYLNPDWKPEQGGALRVTPKDDSNTLVSSNKETTNHNNDVHAPITLSKTKVVDISPISGRVAMFYSSEIPHEVMPTYGNRHAITIWYYDKIERLEAVAKAKELGRGSAAAKTSAETQREVKQFMSDLMGGDEVSEDGGEPSQAELSLLASKVQSLSNDALTIISSITGAPSAESFRQGFVLLTTADLKSMRALFRRMGLNN